MTPQEELTQFLIDNNVPKQQAPLMVHAWFSLIAENVNRAETTEAYHGFTKKQTFELFFPGLLRSIQHETQLTREEVEPIAKDTLVQYLKETKKEAPALPPEDSYLPLRPEYYTMIDTLLSQYLPGIVNKGETTITTGRKKAKTPEKETVEATLFYTDSNGVKIEGNYTLFHEAVFNAFITLWLAGNVWITAAMIQHFLSQNYTSGVKESTEKEIEGALEDMQNMNVKIDMSQEAEKRGITPENMDYFKRGGKMLNLDWCEISIGGHKVKAYTLYNPARLPIVYEHALAMGAKEDGKGEIVTKPVNVLDIRDKDTGKRLRVTNNRVKIRQYLFKQVVNMQRDLKQAKETQRKQKSRNKEAPLNTKMNTVISYATLFQKTGLSDSKNADLIRYRHYIESCLDTWRKAGEIKGFVLKFDGTRKRETGVQILLE